MNEVNVVLVDLPADARGCVVPEEDGSFTVYINSIYNHEQRRTIFNHEMRHLLLDHHYTARPLAQLESEANQPHALLAQIEHAAQYGLPAAPLLPTPPRPACFAPLPQDAPATQLPALPPEALAIQLPAGANPAPWLLGIATALHDIRIHWDALMAEN